MTMYGGQEIMYSNTFWSLLSFILNKILQKAEVIKKILLYDI